MKRDQLKLFRFNRLLAIAILLSGIFAALPLANGLETPILSAPASLAQAGVTCQVFQPGPMTGRDAYIKQDKPDERRGGDSELRVKTENGKLNRSLLQFDLSSLPAGSVVVSATLSLYVKGASGGPVTINAHQVITSWNEAEVTWEARDKAAGLLWVTRGGDYDSAVAGSTVVDNTTNVWRSWNITNLAATWVMTPTSNFGLILEAAVTDPKTEKKFKSSDDGTASQRPKLEVCYSLGVTLEPNNSGEGLPGQTKTYAHVVQVGNITSVINLSASSSQGWTTRIYEDEDGDGYKDPEDDPISQTPQIGPNVDYPILVQVDIPLSAPIGMTDVTTVTATAQSNGASDTATDRTRVGKLLNVQPDNSRYAVAGAVLFYGHTVTNNGDSQDCVTVTATSSQSWSVQLWEDTNHNGVHETNNPSEPPLSNPVCIGAGAIYYLVAEISVPITATAETVDQTVITATSGNQPGESDSATDITQVFVNEPPVIDGKYDEIYRISPDAQEICYTSGGVLFGKLATFYQASGNAVYVVLAIDKDFVDNTYGANAVNWVVRHHNFDDLVGSDRAQFWGYDANDAKVLDFDLDYISTKSGTPSGYASLGVSGGDGGMNTGSAAHILQWGTSLEYSLNSTGYCSGGNCSGGGTNLLVDSPATDAFYTPNPTYPNWIFDVIYEVKIDKAAFGAAGFGSIDIPYIHASPSKIGQNTIYAEPGVCPGEIGDFVWYDADADGVQDSGESGINGVQLKLYKDNGDGIFDAGNDILMGTKTTSAGGKYLFQDLEPNDYFVDVVDATVPAGYVITTNNDPTPIINLAEDQSYLQADFGYVQASTIGDRVWEDLDADGLQDAGEPGLSGVTVKLYTSSNNLVRTAATNASGVYTFTNMVPGNYYVQFTAPAGYIFTLKDQGSNDAVDSDADQTTGKTAVTILSPGETDLTWDAGLYQPATVGDLIWWDVNYNGIQDAGEPGIPGVDVVLSNTTVPTATTDTSGLYTFTNLVSGTYTIKIPDYEFQPGGTLANWIASPQDQGGDDTKDSDGHPTTHAITTALTVGEVDLTNDFGFDIPSAYTITKRLNTIEPVRVGALVSFTIGITNTGNSWIGLLPLRDVYSTTYLSYVNASPASSDNNNDGQIDWSDLTASFGTPLTPTASFIVIVTFTAQADTRALPGGQTVNWAIVHDAYADADGPGPLGAQEPLPQKQDDDDVEIINPTAVVLAGFSIMAQPDRVLVSWQTASEVEILGFNLLRQAGGGEFEAVNEELILAAQSGRDAGASYTYEDQRVISGMTYHYVLEIVKPDGRAERHGSASTFVGWRLRLPLVIMRK